MYKLVLLRHGESVWNKEGLFTGWTDVDLSENGIREAQNAGKTLLESGFEFDIAFTSVLKRAIRTLWIVMDQMDQMWIPVERDWRLNERHYGALQGKDKKEMARQEGEELVHQWRRSYEVRPPALTKDDERYPGNQRMYKNIPEEKLPVTECLKDTVDRFLPYWHERITPEIQKGSSILISAHGNSLRALVKYLDQMTDDEITQLNIPTGIPLVYELDETLNPIQHYYLGDEEHIKQAQEGVANQGKQ